MKLVNVERVSLPRAVFDDPILHRSLMHGDVGLLEVHIEYLGLRAVAGDEVLNRALRIVWIPRSSEK
jgi:hypothetical protein